MGRNVAVLSREFWRGYSPASVLIRRILLVSSVMVCLVSLALAVDLYRFKRDSQAQLFDIGKRNTLELRNAIDAILRRVEASAENLVDEIQKRELSEQDLLHIIELKARAFEEILGVTVAFEPFAFSPSREKFAPYFDKQHGKVLFIDKLYDYTDPDLDTAQWYVTVREQGARWVEPYFAKGAQQWVADYGMPFYRTDDAGNRVIQGTVTITIALKGFTEIVHSLSLGKIGFGLVASGEGVLLAHPNLEYIGTTTLETLAEETDNTRLSAAYRAVLGDPGAGNMEFFDADKNQHALFFFDEVPSSSWRIAVMFYANDMQHSGKEIKRKYMLLFFFVSLLVFLALTSFFARDYLSVMELWQLSAVASIIFVSNVIFVGVLQHNLHDSEEKSERPPITTATAVSNVVNGQRVHLAALNMPAPIPVPVGISIQRMEFAGAYNLNVGGLAWLRLPAEFAEADTPLIAFPQTAPFAESNFVEERYREQQGDSMLVGYDFRITLRLNFDYSHYPFDKRLIAIAMVPADINSRFMFVPDLSSYRNTNPSDLSGLRSDIRIAGSELLESYFSYGVPDVDSRFGYLESPPRNALPVLLFNINVKRVLVTSLVTYLIPILVSLIMIFILVSASKKTEDSMVGGGIVTGLAAFFFVLIFSHIDLRKDVLTGELVYMEYYYFAAYFVIIAAAYNLVTYTRHDRTLFDYGDNILFKTAYWPMFFLSVLIVTLLKFY